MSPTVSLRRCDPNSPSRSIERWAGELLGARPQAHGCGIGADGMIRGQIPGSLAIFTRDRGVLLGDEYLSPALIPLDRLAPSHWVRSFLGSVRMEIRTRLTGVERTFDVDDLIVSKTDLKGRITYANSVFLRIAQFREADILGKPHNLIRHPEMPRCVFRYLWETISQGREVFAYVLNRTRLGDHYWVFAHVTPTFDAQGKITGYHSNRRLPDRNAVSTVKRLYSELTRIEQRQSDPKSAAAAGLDALVDRLVSSKVTYDQYIFKLARKARPQSISDANRSPRVSVQ